MLKNLSELTQKASKKSKDFKEDVKASSLYLPTF